MTQNKKYTCGVALPSACVLYTGELPAFVTAFPCDGSVDDFLNQLGTQAQKLLTETSLAGLDKKCYPALTTVRDFAQTTVSKVCTLEQTVSGLSYLISNLNIGEEVIAIDLKCMTPQAAPCAVAPGSYKLISVLNTIIAELCAIKSSLNL